MKQLIVLCLLLLSIIAYSQPHGNGNGNGPKDKDHPCPPNNPHCPDSVPIGGIEWLILGGIGIGLYYLKQRKIHR